MAIQTFGTRAGANYKAGGQINLDVYLDGGDYTEQQITDAEADKHLEAATEMHKRWRKFTTTPLGYSNDIEARVLADLEENGVVAIAWAQRTVERSTNTEMPVNIITATDKWEKGLADLEAGTILQDYQDDNVVEEDITNDAGTFQSVPMTFEPTSTTDEWSG